MKRQARSPAPQARPCKAGIIPLRGTGISRPRGMGFTLIELIVVVGIIGLLLTIAVSVSSAVWKNSKSRATKMTLETVKSAIDAFAQQDPLRNKHVQFDPTASNNFSKCLFGPFPPSPQGSVTPKATNDSDDSPFNRSAPEDDPKTNPTGLKDNKTRDKFIGGGMLGGPGILAQYLGKEHVGPGLSPDPNSAASYATSECLILFLRTFSPQAKAILDRLGKSLTNEDQDSVRDVGGANVEPLYELRDAWGQAVQYNFWRTPVIGGTQFTWELRSAGEDGKFATPFSDPANSDDIVVSGSLKKEGSVD